MNKEGKKMEEKRDKARAILAKKEWMSFIEYDNRHVVVLSDGSYDCLSYDRFDPEFRTTNIEVALDYLFPN